MYGLSDKEFGIISNKIYDYAGINLTEKKRSLVVARLSKRIRLLELDGFGDYINYLKKDKTGREFQEMVNAISTNYSLFFREAHHFDFLTKHVFPHVSNVELKIWSAAASTGQEIYSVLITLKEYQRKTGTKIRSNLFASDISRNVLIKASQGVYQRKDVMQIDPGLLKEYFLRGTGSQSGYVKIKRDLIKDVKFFQLNLTDEKYSLPLMDVIFLRNAIIYFDKDTKRKLIDRLWHYVKPRGYLILGHSESLSGISDRFSLVEKTVYQRVDAK